MTARPDGACVTHRPPDEGRPWQRPDPGYRTCSACHQRLHAWLSPITTDANGRPDSIPGLYAALSPLPGVGGGGMRRAPGFGSRSPGNDHIIAMGDKRTIKLEQRDPISISGVLAEWVALLVEERALIPPARTVPGMARFLDNHLDHVTRQEWVADFHTELRELHSHLRAIDQPRCRIGACPNTLDTGDTTRQCGAVLYAPLFGDTIKCWAPDCGRVWERRDWLHLGDLLPTG